MGDKRPFVLMVKPVGSRCNMRCRYCYYLEKGRLSQHPRQTRMGFDLLERIIRQAVEAAPGPVVSFVWHGGEPTLAGLDFYKRALELERRYLPRGWEAWNNLQTNGLLINDAWCKFLRENRFDVGVSLDGARRIHDANRPDMGGHGTFDRAAGAVRRLRRFGVEPDILCTVTEDAARAPDEVWEGVRDLAAGWVQFIPIVVQLPGGTAAPWSVSAESWGTFLCRTFDRWVTEDLGRFDVQLFAETARVLAGGSASVCTQCETCGRAPVAEEDGSVYSCDHFVDPEHRLGNIRALSLSDMLDSPRQLSFGEAKRDSLPKECLSCQWLPLCRGSCPKDRPAGERHALCAGYRLFYAHARPILEDMMRQSREGKGPEEIRTAMSAAILSGEAGI